MKRSKLALGLATSAVVAVATAVFVDRVQKVRDAASASKCNGNFTGISVVMRDYHERHGHLPPAFVPGKDGKPAHSWRVLLLEQIDTPTFEAYRFDEPWDGPNNRKLEDKMPSWYACPADPGGKEKWQTNYFVVVGSDTLFPGSTTVRLDDIKHPRAETILIVEAVGQGVHWMEPKDLSFEAMSFERNDPNKPSISSHHRRKPGVYTVDGSMLWLHDIGPDRLREMLLIKKPDEK